MKIIAAMPNLNLLAGFTNNLSCTLGVGGRLLLIFWAGFLCAKLDDIGAALLSRLRARRGCSDEEDVRRLSLRLSAGESEDVEQAVGESEEKEKIQNAEKWGRLGTRQSCDLPP